MPLLFSGDTDIGPTDIQSYLHNLQIYVFQDGFVSCDLLSAIHHDAQEFFTNV